MELKTKKIIAREVLILGKCLIIMAMIIGLAFLIGDNAVAELLLIPFFAVYPTVLLYKLYDWATTTLKQ
jgi:hypothetical protein